MVYKAIKRIYPITTALSFVTFFYYAGKSDYYTKVLKACIPETAYSILAWSLVLMIPAVLFVILDYIKKNYIDREEQER